jgi:hypothetical protein
MKAQASSKGGFFSKKKPHAVYVTNDPAQPPSEDDDLEAAGASAKEDCGNGHDPKPASPNRANEKIPSWQCVELSTHFSIEDVPLICSFLQGSLSLTRALVHSLLVPSDGRVEGISILRCG